MSKPSNIVFKTIIVLCRVWGPFQRPAMNRSVFWNITPSGPLKVNRQFKEICLHLQGCRVNQVRNHHEAGRKLVLDYSLTLKIETTCSTETSADSLRTRGHYIPEDSSSIRVLVIVSELLKCIVFDCFIFHKCGPKGSLWLFMCVERKYPLWLSISFDCQDIISHFIEHTS
jgi:hypothetical protein